MQAFVHTPYVRLLDKKLDGGHGKVIWVNVSAKKNLLVTCAYTHGDVL